MTRTAHGKRFEAPGAHGAMLADRDQTSVAQVGQREADAERESESEPSKK